MKLHRSMKVTLGAAVLASAALVGSGGVAVAAPEEAPRLGVIGEDIWAVGDNSFCSGAIHVGVQVDRARPGQMVVNLEPRGMNGVGPDWDRNPVCRTEVLVTYQNAVFPFTHEARVPLAIGRGAQGPTSVPLTTSSGLNLLGFTTWPLANKGVTYYALIP